MKNNKLFVFPIFLFLLSFSFYIYTLAPSLYFGDSGELITASFVLGVPHPTGFPLYMILGKIFSFIPVGDIAFRINLLSAFFASLTVVFIFFISFILLKDIDITINVLISTLISILFISSYTLLSQANIARVYTLNSFFCALSLFLYLYYNNINESKKILFLLSFITGLGSGIHLTFIIFTGIIWIFLIIKKFKEVKNNLPFLIFFFLIGFSIYTYLIIRGISTTILNWHPFKTFKDFLYYISQRQYNMKMLSRDKEGFFKFFNYVKFVLLREFTIFGFILFLSGIIFSFIKNFKHAILFILLFLSPILLLSLYGNYTDLKLSFRYFIPSYIIFVLFISILFDFLYSKQKKISVIVFLIILPFIIIFSLKNNFYENNRRYNFIPYFYPYDILNTVEDKSYIFLNGDNQLFTIAYFKIVKNFKNKVTVFEPFGKIFKDIYSLQKESKSLKAVPNILMAFNKKLSPLYILTPTQSRLFHEAQWGLLYKICEKNCSNNLLPWKLYSFKGIMYDKIFYDFEEREVVGIYLYRYALSIKENKKLYNYFLKKAEDIAFDSIPVLANIGVIYSKQRDFKKAEELFKKVLTINPENEQVLFNMGSMYASKGDFFNAKNYYLKVVLLNPLNFQAKLYLNKVEAEIKKIEEKNKLLKKINEHYDEGKILLSQKLYDKAIEEFKKDIKNNPDLSPRSYFHIGLCYSLKNDFLTAIKYYKKVLKKEPQNVPSLNNIGLCYLKLNNKEKAISYFKKSLEVNPDQKRIQKILNEISK